MKILPFRQRTTTIKRRINIAAVGSSRAATDLLEHPTPDSEKKPLCISVLSVFSVVKNSAFFRRRGRIIFFITKKKFLHL
jgi:hypothetical protein